MLSEWASEQGNKYVMEPIGNFFKNVAMGTWNWFVEALPDIMGYGALATGAIIVLSSMTGNGGIIKPIAYYAGGLIVALCILL